MKYPIGPSSCRICLRKTKRLCSLHLALQNGDELPSKMLELLCGIKLTDNPHNDKSLENIPHSICKNCQLSLNLAYNFRLKALKSHRIIENLLKSSQKAKGDVHHSSRSRGESSSHVKAEHLQQVSHDIEDEDSIGSTDEDVDYILQLGGGVKQEDAADTAEAYTYMIAEPMAERHSESHELFELSEGQDPEDEEVDIDDTAMEEDDVVEETATEPAHDMCDDLIESETESVSEAAALDSETGNAHVTDADGEDDAEQWDVNFLDWEGLDDHELIAHDEAETGVNSVTDEECASPAENSRPSVSAGAKRRKKHDTLDGSSPKDGKTLGAHICDVCGNIFEKRGRMMEHRRRHNKELRYACELCDQRFHLRENLRKHMYSHTGGKPYKCNFCSRTFFYQSVKNAHEAVHQGHKPYVCQTCNKAFAYSHALKKHKLIHAEIKLYHCEYCDKDFRLQHHMKQHVETKMHQNAVRAAEMRA